MPVLILYLSGVCNAFYFSACTTLGWCQPLESGGQEVSSRHHEDGIDIDGRSNEDDDSQEERRQWLMNDKYTKKI